MQTDFFTTPSSAVRLSLREPPGRKSYSDMDVRDKVEFGAGRSRAKTGQSTWFIAAADADGSAAGQFCYADHDGPLLFTPQRTPQLFMAVFSPVQLIASIPPVTRFYTATTVLLSFFYLYLQWKSETGYPVPYLTLVPGSSLFYPWTFFTSVFVETTVYEVCLYPSFQPNSLCNAILQFIFTLIAIPPCLRYLERLWGAIETIKFIVVTATISNIIAFGLNWIEFIVLKNADLFLWVEPVLDRPVMTHF